MIGDTRLISKSVLFLLVWSPLPILSQNNQTTCYNPEVKVVNANVSYLTPITEIYYVWCFSWTFRCQRESTRWETRWKLENITRVVNTPTCCPGWQGEVGSCKPHCPQGCVHGQCSAPGLCSCEMGFSGGACQDEGCPSGKWGEGCGQTCDCRKGLNCNSLNGTCICSPGYRGEKCLEECPVGLFGQDCAGKCNCTAGTYCHGITGECVPCAQGSYGSGCGNNCTCSSSGTALCSPKDGECYCRANWFGGGCHLNCPFGFQNGSCLSYNESVCSCPNYLYYCDKDLGCICPQGIDCGIEQIEQVDVEKYRADTPHRTVVIAVSTVLSLGLVGLILLILYYRRRLASIRRKARHGAINPGGPGTSPDILNPEPLPSLGVITIQDDTIKNNKDTGIRTPPPQSGVDNPAYIVNYSKPEKNVNISKPQNNDNHKVNYGSTEGTEAVSESQKDANGTETPPWSLLDEFQNKYGKTFDDDFEFEDEFEDDHYDRLDRSRTFSNDLSPNYSSSNIFKK